VKPINEPINDLDMPEGLDGPGRRAYEIITAYLRAHGRTGTDGCKAFYAPSTWDQEYGTRSHLVVVYGGEALRPVFSMDAAYDLDCAHYRQTGKSREPYALYEGMQEKLREAGLYFEECTRYYCAVYSVNSTSSDEEDEESTSRSSLEASP
jgi:hypothetical protein